MKNQSEEDFQAKKVSKTFFTSSSFVRLHVGKDQEHFAKVFSLFNTNLDL